MEKRFNNLAVIICGIDSYSFLWDAWYWYFRKNWDIELCNVYFLNEKKEINFPDVKQIKIDINCWTKKVRESLNEITENDIFFFMADHFIVKKFEHNEFEHIYQMYESLNADALRIRPVTPNNSVHPTFYFVNNINIKKFSNESQYLISNGFNIIKKSFFLECLKVDESAWDNEVKGTERIRDSRPDIYIYEKFDWYVDVCRGGEVVPEGQALINEYKKQKS